MITTPFAALEPYNAVEAASFRIVKDAISSWLMELRSPSYWIPSTTKSGSELPFSVPTPRITISGLEPGWPFVEVNCTPVVLPSIAAIGEVTFRVKSSFAPITLAEPVNASLVVVPYATTITSSNVLSACKLTLCVALLTTTFWVA